nr:hypothetical protein VCHA53O474_30291 [Vibrio chagasii]
MSIFLALKPDFNLSRIAILSTDVMVLFIGISEICSIIILPRIYTVRMFKIQVIIRLGIIYPLQILNLVAHIYRVLHHSS